MMTMLAAHGKKSIAMHSDRQSLLERNLKRIRREFPAKNDWNELPKKLNVLIAFKLR